LRGHADARDCGGTFPPVWRRRQCESFDAAPDALTYNPADYHDPRIVLLSVEVGGRSVRINVTMDEGLVARLDSLADRAHASRSALLARGARMVLAAEAAD
jgi:hypothetical protein